MDRGQDEMGDADQKTAIASLVQEVAANGVYEIAVTRAVDTAATV